MADMPRPVKHSCIAAHTHETHITLSVCTKCSLLVILLVKHNGILRRKIVATLLGSGPTTLNMACPKYAFKLVPKGTVSPVHLHNLDTKPLMAAF